MTSASLGTAYVRIAPDMTGMQGKVLSGFKGLGAQAESQMGKELKSGTGFNAGMAALWGAATSIAQKAIDTMMTSLDKGIKRFDTLSNYPKIMQNLGYSAQESTQSINRMSEAATGLPTSLDSLATTTKVLAPLSENLGEATSLAIGLNDAFLASGASSADAERGLEQLSQMFSRGTVDLEGWRTAQETMPSSLSQLAKMLGITSGNTNELYEAMKSGKISMDDFKQAVITMDTQGGAGFASFHTQALDATGGIQTGLDNLGNAWARVWQRILAAIGNENITAFFQKQQQNIKAVGDVLEAGVKFVIKYQDQLKVLAGVVASLGAGFAAASIASQIQNITSAISKAGGIVQWASGASGGLSQLFKVIKTNPVIAIVAAIATALGLFFTQTETGRNLLSQFAKTASDVFGKLSSAVAPVLTTLGQTVGNVFQSLAPTLTSVGQTVGNVFQSLAPTLGQVASTIGGTLTNAFQAIAPVIGTVAQAFGGFVEAAAPAVSGVIQSLAPTFQSIGQALQQMFPSLQPLGQAFAELGKSLGNAVTTLAPTFAELGKTIGSLIPAIGTALANAFKAIAPLLPVIGQAFAQIAKSLGGTLANAVATLAPALGQLAVTLGQALGTTLQAIAPVIGTIAGAIASILPIIVSLAAQLITSVLPPIMQLISTVLPAIAQLITSVLPPIMQLVSAVLPVLAQIIAAILPVVLQVVTAVLPPLIAIINNVLIPAITMIVNIVTTVINAVVPIIQTAINTITSVIQVFVDLFSGNFTKLGQDIGNIWRNMWNLVGSILSGAWNVIKSVVQGLWDFIRNIFSGMWNGISGAINNFKNNLVSFFKGIPGAISGAFSAIGNVGKNLVQGLWNGINDMGKWIGEKIKGFGKGVMDSLKNFFGIHSPSTVMRDQIGRYLSLGLAEGITTNAGAVTNALSDMGNAALSQFSDIDSQLSSGLTTSITADYGGLNPSLVNPQVIVNQDIKQMSNQVDATEVGYQMGYLASEGINQLIGAKA